MAKLQDKFFNRVIEGNLELEQNENNQVSVLVVPAIAGKDIAPKDVTASGDASVAGDLTVGDDINADGIYGNEIVENMSGYSAEIKTIEDLTIENVFQGAVKNGNKLTIVSAFKLTRTDTISAEQYAIKFTIPSSVSDKLYPAFSYFLAAQNIDVFNVANRKLSKNIYIFWEKDTNAVNLWIDKLSELDANVTYYLRAEVTFLLSDNLIPQ